MDPRPDLPAIVQYWLVMHPMTAGPPLIDVPFALPHVGYWQGTKQWRQAGVSASHIVSGLSNRDVLNQFSETIKRWAPRRATHYRLRNLECSTEIQWGLRWVQFDIDYLYQESN